MNLPTSATEDQFHGSVAELLDVCLIPPTFYTTFPAGYGRLSKATAGRLKAKGMKPGMPDILIFNTVAQPHPTQKRSHVIGLELKVRGNTPSAAQRATHAQLQAVGVRVFIIRSINQVLMALAEAGIKYRNVHIPVGKTDVEPIREVAHV